MTKKLDVALKFCMSGNLKAAKEIYLELIKNDPNNFEINANLALIFYQENDLSNAENFSTQAIKIKNDPNQIKLLLQIKRLLKKYNEALEINGLLKDNDILYTENKVNILRDLGKLEESQNLCIEKINNGIESYQIYINLGLVNIFKENYDSAIEFFKKAIKINPTSEEAAYNISLSLYKQGLFKQSIDVLKKIKQGSQNYLRINKLLASNYQELNLYIEAKEIWEKLVKYNVYEAYIALGNIASIEDNIDEAKKNYKKAIEINSLNWIGYFKLGELFLKQGEWIKGFDLFKWRIKEQDHFVDDMGLKEIDFNKELHIYDDQGIGDKILNIRFLDKIRNKASNGVYLYVDPRLITIFKLNFPDFIVNERPKSIKYKPNCIHLNLSSLCRFFVKNDEDLLPINLKLPIDTAVFDDLIKFKKEKKIIGISWKSNNKAIGEKKSIPLKMFFTKLSNMKNIIFVNLQYGDTSDEIKAIQKEFNVQIVDFKNLNLYDDINKLFQLVDLCDVVITTSNINAHVSGSLAKNTFVFAPTNNSRLWYWGTNNQVTSILYPSVTIINQDKTNGWIPGINLMYEKIMLHLKQF